MEFKILNHLLYKVNYCHNCNQTCMAIQAHYSRTPKSFKLWTYRDNSSSNKPYRFLSQYWHNLRNNLKVLKIKRHCPLTRTYALKQLPLFYNPTIRWIWWTFWSRFAKWEKLVMNQPIKWTKIPPWAQLFQRISNQTLL